ncbi:transglycosylase SLT domain-containing protein [Marinimicrobium locisalis]|uniref:transglycosylase SLT domain-containing protein n=1 Tax=Marinimicrobium locisalis TaxID=546022 RepID=UPI003221D9AC
MHSQRLAARLARLTLYITMTLPAAGLASEASTPAEASDPLADQRALYLQARDALSKRQMQRYEHLYEQLADYPLRPYLTYHELTRTLARAEPEHINRFVSEHEGSYLARQLQRQWLNTLASEERWEQYLSSYRGTLGDTDLQCYALQARLEQGDADALAQVDALWNVAHSQPDACDPLFAAWMKAGRLTADIAWERHYKAVQARNLALASYIARQMPEAEQRLAQLLREVDRHPQVLAQSHRFRSQSEAIQTIINHGLRRLARRDAIKALELWRGYDAQQLFSNDERLATQEAIARRLIDQDHREHANQLLSTIPTLSGTDLVESIIRDALGQLDWARAYTWLNQLPPEEQDSERWRYWRARLIEELELQNTGPEPRDLYAAVAATRSFYGFLSADKLGFEYRLLDRPAEVSEATLQAVENLPPLKRARELLLIGDINNASREWYYTVPSLEKTQILAAGKLAERWGWHRKGIQAMASARFWDDLGVRFPLAYQEHVKTAADATSIHPHLLFAIARQESAFMAHARSPAGALGLMQLMPATAQQTARRAGVPYRRADLLSPDTNITLGSRYLHELLDEFNGNRILATAAYNAGPYRVKQWLKNGEQNLPYDVWIETIPFRETRGYVQNVLSYSVIYSYRMGEKSSFITAEEAGHAF